MGNVMKICIFVITLTNKRINFYYLTVEIFFSSVDL